MQNQRNRTKEFFKRCQRKGTHRFVMLVGDNEVYSCYESTDYAAAYGAALLQLQRVANSLIRERQVLNMLPGTYNPRWPTHYRYEFRE